MPSIVLYWLEYGVINNCESTGTTFEIVTFVIMDSFRDEVIRTI